MFLDEQFNTVTTNGLSGATAVGGNNVLKSIHNAVNISKNGYLYVYCSNESDINVFFDNLQVIQTHGPLIEETHYYPFGLTMAGISSQALNFGGSENNKLYNKGSELQHHEFSDGSGLELYSTEFRSLDPQLGRWWQVDPKPNYAESPYCSMGNNPILHNDPLGDVYHLSGDTKDEKKYLSYLKSVTGNTYRVDKSGNIHRVNKVLNTKTTSELSGTLSRDIDAAIKTEGTVSFNLVNSDVKNHDITFDKYSTGEVDMKDLAQIKDHAFLAGVIGHFLSESMQVPDISKRKGTFDASHPVALKEEGKIVTEMLRIPNQARSEEGGYPNIATGKTDYIYNYGQAKYKVETGVTQTKDAGGVIYTSDNVVTPEQKIQ